ncbi:MAG: phenylalanine--tRNA ligase subunit beta [bacterium]
MPGGGVVHAPTDWIADWADLPDDVDARGLAAALVRVGLEVEKVESAGDALTGPIVVGRVLSRDAEPQNNGKTINWCSVDVGEEQPRGIVCGAHNFEAGDLVVVALPGAELAGGFAISARRTYGHVSDGMICSVRELGIGEDHAGILVLPAEAAKPGADALDVLGLRAAVLDIAVTPDRGYCLSMRGLAREAAGALGVTFRDVAATVAVPTPDADGYPVRVADPQGCDRFSARSVTGLDPAAATPDWMRQRLRAAGMRPISLAVDVTNYVMLETGQPLHAFDRAKLSGALGVRRAAAGERLTTLDSVTRALDPEDLVVTDDTGPVALAGVMGGAATEIDAGSTDVVLEAAHWNPTAIARAVRRHRLPSEAAKRFERNVDPEIAAAALQRCVDLLVEHGGATAAPGFTVVGEGPSRPVVRMRITRPQELAGREISPEVVRGRLLEVGCTVDGEAELVVTAPSWRPDLTGSADLVEEVVRLEGYDTVPSVLPVAPPGRGLTPEQTLARTISRAVAAAGYVEVLTNPFLSPTVFDALGLPPDDSRRAALRVANPLAETEPLLRTTLLPGLLATLARNVGRGQRDAALSETGLVFLAEPATPPVPTVGVAGRPSDVQIAALNAAVPIQPRNLAVVLAGEREPSGWWGPGRPAGWGDAVEAARTVARAARVEVEVTHADVAPWHPGRCAELRLGGTVVGHAGELHPRVVRALDLPPRTSAMELDLTLFTPPPPAPAPTLTSYPPVLLDVALVVDAAVPAADVEAALRTGAGPLLESVRLFDVYIDETRLGPGRRSLAYALRLRAPDRTMTIEEATTARDAAVAEATVRTGARLRE